MTDTQKSFEVRVIESSTNQIALRIGPGSIQKMEKAERGVLINLDHANYHTEIVEVTA